MTAITEDSLKAYLAHRKPEWRDAEISGLNRLPMGASRETFRFDLHYSDEAGQRQLVKLILRRDPPASNVDSDRRHEYLSYDAIYGHGIPVPRMILLEEDSSHFDGAISLAEDLRGFHNSEYQLQEPAWRDRLPRIADGMWTYMGKLAAVPVEKLDLSFMRPATPETVASQELAYWVDVMDKNDVGPEPIMRAAIRKLERWQPIPQKLAMVHGDFRAGNFLYDDEGTVKAILDWEMAHIGDPLEDLAWSILRVFSFGKDDRRSGLVPRAEAIAIWERASGMTVDPRAFAWWELFNCVKAQAIWNSCAAIWARNTNREVIYAYAPWWLRNAQDRAALEIMEKL